MVLSDKSTAPPYDYVAYIDESGDPNLERVRPIDSSGSTEWLIMGAAVIEAKNEVAPPQWARTILGAMGGRRRLLHYNELTDWQKPIACRELARLPVQLFAMISNKKNMRQHRNERAAAKSSTVSQKQWFYNFCVRLLLERVTHFVAQHSVRTYGEPRYVKIIFSRRDKHGYGHEFAYNEILKAQAKAGTTYLNRRTIKFEVMDYRLLETEPHKLNAGLALADIVPSAFFQAVDILPPTRFNSDNARLLRPRMATHKGAFENYGVTFVPYNYSKAALKPEQIDIFEYYGFHRFDFHERM